MVTRLNFPELFNFTAPNLALEWKQWTRQFRLYILATRSDEENEEVLVTVLLSLLGREGIKIIDCLTLTENEGKRIDPVLAAFATYFHPQKSERFLVHRRHQQSGESFDTWLVDLRIMVKSCGYGTQAVEESIVRDQIVLRVASEQVRKKTLFENNLTLAGACRLVRAC